MRQEQEQNCPHDRTKQTTEETNGCRSDKSEYKSARNGPLDAEDQVSDRAEATASHYLVTGASETMPINEK